MSERRKWSFQEDQQLSNLIEQFGTNWKVISDHLHYRLPKQCRERWINHLGPGIVKGKLTEHEWNIVVSSRVTLGNRWSEIAKLLPGRTPNQIKNVWHAMERKRIKEDEVINPNDVSLKRKTDMIKEEDLLEDHPMIYPPTHKRPKLEFDEGLQFKIEDFHLNNSETDTESREHSVSSSSSSHTEEDIISHPSSIENSPIIISPLDALVLIALEFYENEQHMLEKNRNIPESILL
jgi:hypothetical protein